ncbi:thioredoxin-disulfide reductase [Candidatus Curtissbacteria bacterium]|nr:thioredoxin-disulfide reductase [Candidatus Curtissbacteria bacterium]
MSEVRNVIILGSGPAGLTAALYTSRADLKPLVIAGITWGGQLMLTTDVENYPGFPEGIQGPDLMANFRKQAERFGAEIINENVTKVDFKSTPFKVWVGEKEYLAKSIIVSTGAETNWLGLPSEQKLIGRGVSSCAPCDAFFFRGKKVIVVGGGDSAMEEAGVLSKFATEVTIVHRRDEFRASKIMADRAKENPKISFKLNSEVIDVLGEQKVEGVRLKDTKSGEESEISIDGMFVAIGHSPLTKIFKGELDLDQKGYVKRLPEKDSSTGMYTYKTMTSLNGIFVAGDVHDYHYQQAVTAAGYGCQAALEVERWLEENH